MENFNAREVGHQYVTNLLERENQGEWVWYHCYHYFSKVRYQKLTATDYNMLSLHLSVYLAEEKMYHGHLLFCKTVIKVTDRELS
ncbi:hypothetical protein ACWN8P_13075 [Vagococcus salmoninarum]|uniref:Uncharacterized protein n=1 Tax=Vagococcus salmoninarum TaxID=2739 RepID=A0A429ZDD2_9ENTE|nr:hypothetical protein [Vagococcus salmoninarum]RST91718.1 hypothetical protein CBF35_13850 [Vagococcus salmoninarum]